MSALQRKLAVKTDKELLYYLQNPEKHTQEAVEIALSELQKRNVEITSDLINDIKTYKEQITIQKNSDSNSLTRNIVQDIDTPAIYSHRTIYTFSILCTVFFGAFLLAANLKDIGKPRWPIFLFAVLYTVLSIIILNHFSRNLSYTFIANSLGVVLMFEIFWKHYIGKETKYRVKPIWKPLVIALIIFIPYIWILLTF
jgi:uncharacterized membrane protein YhaH (DUF805 family)